MQKATYSVWHETASGKDGEKTFDDIEQARDAYNEACSNPAYVRVSLEDSTDPEEPVSLAYYDATDDD